MTMCHCHWTLKILLWCWLSVIKVQYQDYWLNIVMPIIVLLNKYTHWKLIVLSRFSELRIDLDLGLGPSPLFVFIPLKWAFPLCLWPSGRFRAVAPYICASRCPLIKFTSHSTTRQATSFVAVWKANYRVSSSLEITKQQSHCIKSMSIVPATSHISIVLGPQKDQLCLSLGHTHINLLWILCSILKNNRWQLRKDKIKGFFWLCGSHFSSSISEYSWVLPELQSLTQSLFWSLRVVLLRGPYGDQPAFKMRKPTIRPELKP